MKGGGGGQQAAVKPSLSATTVPFKCPAFQGPAISSPGSGDAP